jgi:hypothetical protein
LLAPLFLRLSVPLILGGAAWIFLRPSEILNQRVRSAALQIAALIAVAGLLVFATANIISAHFACSLLMASVAVTALITAWLLRRSLFGVEGLS